MQFGNFKIDFVNKLHLGDEPLVMKPLLVTLTVSMFTNVLSDLLEPQVQPMHVVGAESVLRIVMQAVGPSTIHGFLYIKVLIE